MSPVRSVCATRGCCPMAWRVAAAVPMLPPGPPRPLLLAGPDGYDERNASSTIDLQRALAGARSLHDLIFFEGKMRP